MRVLLLVLLLAGSLSASEPVRYPLWNNHESVAEYAKKINLPPTKTLDLGNGVTMELVLIPAGTFTMGTPEPVPVDEIEMLKPIQSGQLILAAASGVLLVLIGTIFLQAIVKRQPPKFSLARLLMLTAIAGVAVLGGLHWHQSAWQRQMAKAEYSAARARFMASRPDDKPGHSVTITQPFYTGKFW